MENLDKCLDCFVLSERCLSQLMSSGQWFFMQILKALVQFALIVYVLLNASS